MNTSTKSTLADTPKIDMPHKGIVYRAINPIYARPPRSGYGSQLNGGRFNPKGTPAIYTGLKPTTALREFQRAGSFQPTVLVAFDIDIANVFDCRDAEALAAQGMTPADLAADTWRDEMRLHGIARTQEFAQNLINQDFHAMLVRSHVKGSRATDLNLVIWKWGDGPPSRVTLIDDEDRMK